MGCPGIPQAPLPRPLEDFIIKALPSSSYYIADFISQEEEKDLLRKVCPRISLHVSVSLMRQDFTSAETSMEAAFQEKAPNLAVRSH